jgi:CRP-like cAMP-binding protein
MTFWPLLPKDIIDDQRVAPRRALSRARAGLETMRATLRLIAGEPIRNSNEHDSNLCCLDRGAARLSTAGTAKSGQIVDFLVPGDFFVVPTLKESFVIEATIDDTIVVSYAEFPIRQIHAAKVFRKRSYDEVIISTAERFQRQILILGKPTDAGKCLSFLRDMADRLKCCRGNPKLLPICVSDIANYLAMTPSRVEELLLCCERLGAVNFVDRSCVMIINPKLLTRISSQDFPFADD